MATYKDYVRALSSRNPSLQTLHAFLSNPRPRKAESRVIVLDYCSGELDPRTRVVPDIDMLYTELIGVHDNTENDRNISSSHHSTLQGRLIMVEDLTVGMIELLGSTLDIDPLFFAMHLHTARRTGMRHQPADTATLPSRLLSSEFMTISYHRSVTTGNTIPSGSRFLRGTAVERKLVFLRSTNIGFVQHRASVIKVRREKSAWIALVLVDPPLEEPHFISDHLDHPASLDLQPYLGRYDDFMGNPVFSSDVWRTHSTRSRDGIMDDLVDCWQRGIPDCFDRSNPSIQSLAFYPLKIVASEWIKYTHVMRHCVKLYEYHGQQLPGLEQVSTDLRELQGWRRRSIMSQQKINSIIRKLEACENTQSPESSLLNLLEDYKVICEDIESAGRRLENMLPVLASLVQIIDARQSLTETANISRLTILALLFVPLSFVASLFSMNEDNGPGGPYFWVYFTVAIPITTVVFFAARPPIRQIKGVARRISRHRSTHEAVKEATRASIAEEDLGTELSRKAKKHVIERSGTA